MQIFEGRFFPNKKQGDMTLRRLSEMWLEAAAHKQSLSHDRQRFATILEMLSPTTRVGALTAGDLERLKKGLRTRDSGRKSMTLSPATVNRHLALLKSALRLAAQRGYHHQNPFAGVKMLPERNERDRICSSHEYGELLAQAGGDLATAIIVAHDTGMRLGEIAALRWQQVDLDRREIRLAANQTKTAMARVVPITEHIRAHMKALPRSIDGAVLHTGVETLSRNFATLCHRLGLKHLGRRGQAASG